MSPICVLNPFFLPYSQTTLAEKYNIHQNMNKKTSLEDNNRLGSLDQRVACPETKTRQSYSPELTFLPLFHLLFNHLSWTWHRCPHQPSRKNWLPICQSAVSQRPGSCFFKGCTQTKALGRGHIFPWQPAPRQGADTKSSHLS